jgi:hypothetical protein
MTQTSKYSSKTKTTNQVNTQARGGSNEYMVEARSI